MKIQKVCRNSWCYTNRSNFQWNYLAGAVIWLIVIIDAMSRENHFLIELEKIATEEKWPLLAFYLSCKYNSFRVIFIACRALFQYNNV
jgi:hypothetical protein